MKNSCVYVKFLLQFLLWISISRINGQSNSRCVDCSEYFQNCVGPALDLVYGDDDDANYEFRTTKDKYQRQFRQCVPNYVKITGDIKNYICFAQPRCTCIGSGNNVNKTKICGAGRKLCRCPSVRGRSSHIKSVQLSDFSFSSILIYLLGLRDQLVINRKLRV